MAKRIIVMHGRSTKPDKETKEAFVLRALLSGLGRVDAAARAKVENGGVEFDLAYYGDINNAVMWASRQRPRVSITPRLIEQWDTLPKPREKYESADKYEEPLATLLAVTDQGKDNYHSYRDRYESLHFGDDLLDALSPLAAFFGFNDELLDRLFPDLAAYFDYRLVGSAVRDRLQRLLLPALENGDDVCLIAHSMGTIVAYDVLWKLSRMSEYRAVRDRKVSKLITLGSPLGDDAIMKRLYDADEPDDGMYPTNVSEWHNVSAKDDMVSHDEDLADDFGEMKRLGYLHKNINDSFVYTFWVGRDGALNPHNLYGYLDNALVARSIAKWING